MKLSTITENWRSTGDKLNYICGGHVCDADYLNSQPISILFVESAFTAGLITEAEASALTTLFRAGLAKLQNALTPNTADDLDALLTFVAPTGGGVQQVKNLIQTAKSNRGSITSNQQWWNELFQTFNIADNAIQREVQSQVATNIGGSLPRPQQPQAPAPQAPTETDIPAAEIVADTPEAEGQPEPTPRQTTPPLRTTPRDWLSDLQHERQQVVDQQSRLADLLAQSKSARQDTNERLQALSKRLEELKSQGATESLAVNYATMILEFPRVRTNLPAITELMVRSGGRRFAAISEAGLGTRTNQAIQAVPGFFENLGRYASDIVSNPAYAKSKFQASGDANNNERGAKLAVRILTDHIRKQFAQKLQQANATPQEIVTDLGKFQGYQNRLNAASGADPANIFSPEELNEYRSIQQKLRTVYRLFNQDQRRPFNTPPRKKEEPITAEVVDDFTEVGDDDLLEITDPEPPEAPREERFIDYIEQQRMVPRGIATALRTGLRRGALNGLAGVTQVLYRQKLLNTDQLKQALAATRSQ